MQSCLAAALLFDAINTRCIGFYIEKRSPIKCIKSPDHEKVSFSSYKIHNRKPDRVGPVGRPCGKNPVFCTGTRRSCLEEIPVGAVEPVEDDQVGVVIHIL